jgi:hypothetical protein
MAWFRKSSCRHYSEKRARDCCKISITLVDPLRALAILPCRTSRLNIAVVLRCNDNQSVEYTAVAQFERSLIAERVKSGLANARANGKTLGRPSLRKLSPAETRQLRQERMRRNVPFRVLARKFGVSVWTAHRLCASHS